MDRQRLGFYEWVMGSNVALWYEEDLTAERLISHFKRRDNKSSPALLWYPIPRGSLLCKALSNSSIPIKISSMSGDESNLTAG